MNDGLPNIEDVDTNSAIMPVNSEVNLPGVTPRHMLIKMILLTLCPLVEMPH